MANETRYHLLDGIRGVAALAVVFYHLSMRVDVNAFRSGAPAVDLFFALSGFVLAKRYTDRLAAGLTVKRFMALRFIRLEPLAIIGAALGSVKMVGQILTGDDAALSPVAFAFGTLLNGVMLPLPAGSVGMFPINAPYWSLFAELVVNLAFAAWLFAVPTRGLVALAGVSFAILIVYTWPEAHLPTGYWTYLPGMLSRVTFGFVVGMVFARARPVVPKPSCALSTCILVAILIVTFPAINPDWKSAYDLFAIFVLLSLLWAALHVEATGRLAAACKVLGDLSYPIYVIHYPLLGIGWAIAERLGGDVWLFAALYILVVVIASALLLRYYDTIVRAKVSQYLPFPRT